MYKTVDILNVLPFLASSNNLFNFALVVAISNRAQVYCPLSTCFMDAFYFYV